MNEENKPKIEGLRKLGIGMSAIAALTTIALKGDADFKIAIIISIIAIVGIIVQGILDYAKKEKAKPD